MNLYLLVLFFVVLLLAFYEEYLTEVQKLSILAVMSVAMIVMATCKDIASVPDAESYESIFYHYDDPIYQLATEPTYIYISHWVLMFGGGISAVFFIYALLCIPSKLIMLKEFTPFVFTAMLIYVPVYHELHDLIQIRAAVAGAFLLVATKACIDKKHILTSVACLAATLFHYSSIAFIPFFILGNKQIGKKLKICMMCLVPLGFAMYFAHKDMLSLLPSSIVSGKVDYYKSSSESGGTWDEMTIPYKNIYFMVKCMMFYVIIFYYDYLKDKVTCLPILLKIEAGSLFVMLGMATIPVVATRLSDLYGIVDPILFSYCLYLVKPKYAARIAVACVGAYMLVYNMLVAHYFD